MRSRLAALAALILALLTVALVPTSAVALSCVAMTPSTPVDLVRGAPLYENAEGPRRLFDTYDHVVVGRVTGIRPPAGTAARSPGGVSVDLDVLAVVNRPTTAATVTVTMGDHGEMSGYRFEVGEHYAVVVNADDSYGVCGPTASLSDVDPDPSRAVVLLREAARASGVPFALPAAAPATGAPTVAAPLVDGDAPPGSDRGTAAIAAASAGVVVVGSAGLIVRRRRRTADGNVPG